VRVSLDFAIGRYLSGFAELIELRLKASTRLNHGRIIWMRRAACHARFGSIGDIPELLSEVCFPAESGHRAFMSTRPKELGRPENYLSAGTLAGAG
jgi:hypothetical protein